MSDLKYRRLTQTAVTNFLCCGDEYLFLKRNKDKRVDPGKLNGIGGRLEAGEDYLQAAIRETKEESGYVVTQENIKLSGVVKLIGGFFEDWVMCFFRIEVKDKNIPIGSETEDGELIWIHKDKVLDTEFELIDDIYYCFREIVEQKEIFFLTLSYNDSQKVVSHSMSKILI